DCIRDRNVTGVQTCALPIFSNNVSERWRLGQYLHDKLSQVLAAVKIMINEIQDNVAELDDETTGYISRVKKMIDENISGIRDLAHDIIPVDVEEEGFRSEEHTSELQSRFDLVCRLLLE